MKGLTKRTEDLNKASPYTVQTSEFADKANYRSEDRETNSQYRTGLKMAYFYKQLFPKHLR